MGAEGWKVQLRHRGWNVGARHRSISNLGGAKGFRCEDDLEPWSHDSEALVFVTWDEQPVHVYDLGAKSLRNVPCDSDYLYSAQWSPSVDRLLVTSTDRAVLTNRDGTWRGSASWRIAPQERPHTQWTRDGHWFFVLAREATSAKVMLTFHAGEDGRVGEAYELDPIDLAPYDAERYADLPRDGLCLIMTSATGGIGQLLDTWHRVQFDQPSNTLYLAVFRPVSAAYKSGEAWLCDVEERWVAVALASD